MSSLEWIRIRSYCVQFSSASNDTGLEVAGWRLDLQMEFVALLEVSLAKLIFNKFHYPTSMYQDKIWS